MEYASPLRALWPLSALHWFLGRSSFSSYLVSSAIYFFPLLSLHLVSEIPVHICWSSFCLFKNILIDPQNCKNLSPPWHSPFALITVILFHKTEVAGVLATYKYNTVELNQYLFLWFIFSVAFKRHVIVLSCWGWNSHLLGKSCSSGLHLLP